MRHKSKVTIYIKHREFREDCTKFFVESVLCELHFSHIEVADATNLEVFVDDLFVGGKDHAHSTQTVGDTQ